MSVLEWFSSQQTGAKSARSERLDIPGDLWIKCPSCGSVLYNKELEGNLKVCLSCSYHFRLSAAERIGLTVDENSFKEFNESITSKDFLNFTDLKPYKDRIKESEEKSGIKDAIVTGEAKIEGLPLIISVMDFSYMGGSMGSVVGEKFTRAAEKALSLKVPFVVFSASGGARMQEGIMSLMQMAKTSAILSKLSDAHVPYIVVLTDPTTGGTTASFAMLGDIHIAEKGALIAFAGPRVIEQTIRQKLPKGFQKAEYLEEHGFVDMVLPRQDIKVYLARILKLFSSNK
jgi:acetyl-CoA carboxylase carboxyl transferase subunit beta